jgi:hypothetical protein
MRTTGVLSLARVTSALPFGVDMSAGGSMSRSLVGLLAAVGTTMSVLAGLIHCCLEPLAMAAAALAAGLAAYLAIPPIKKSFGYIKLM